MLYKSTVMKTQISAATLLPITIWIISNFTNLYLRAYPKKSPEIFYSYTLVQESIHFKNIDQTTEFCLWNSTNLKKAEEP
jgi:hypothetical protein